MALGAVQKVAIYTSKDVATDVLDAIQQLAVFEYLPHTKEEVYDAEHEQVSAKKAGLGFCVRYLSPLLKAPKGLYKKVLGDRIESTEAEAEARAKEDFSALIEACTKIEEEENAIKAERAKKEELLRVLKNWETLPIPLKSIQSTNEVEVVLGSIESKEYIDFEAEIIKESLTSLHLMQQGEKEYYVMVLFHKSVAVSVQDLLQSYRFSPADFGAELGTVVEEMAEIERALEAMQTREETLEKEKKRYVDQIEAAKLAHDALDWKGEQLRAYGQAEQTEKTVIIRGYVPEDQRELLEKSIAEVTPYAYVSTEKTQEAEEVPVVYRNKSFFRPLESIVSLFSPPKKDEMDPTPFIAPFFIIFFGLCLTDAGYGLLLFLTLTYMRARLPLEKEVKDFLQLFIYGSISTIIMGILFGGYFGMTQEQLSFLAYTNAEGEMVFYGQVFDSINGLTDRVMPLIYGLAVLQLFLANTLGAIKKWKRKERRRAILGNGGVAVMILLAIVALLTGSNLTSLFLATLVLIFIGFLPSTGNIFARPFIALIGIANEGISWLSNVLSYSRLFALGLATGIIAFSFNSIALIMGNLLPIFIGLPLAIAIILLGHTINIGLAFLGAFVHSTRLQLVEFFGSFYEGGGRNLKPFKRERAYLFVKK